ncbi:MAG: hypothetical protein SVX43_09870 [Cyanobacteriota bacterium]|nr:hypothetical protein [Cyanobacteriota bacterium]
MFNFNNRHWIALAVLLAAAPVLAREGNFDPLTLQSGFGQTAVNGFTGGSVSFPDKFGSRDRNNNQCLGYGDTNPDHIMVLEDDLPQLTIRINSGRNDTTLVIQGPDSGTLRCGDDSGSNPDASIEDFNWKSGTYNVWVGSVEPGQRWNYRLSASEN